MSFPRTKQNEPAGQRLNPVSKALILYAFNRLDPRRMKNSWPNTSQSNDSLQCLLLQPYKTLQGSSSARSTNSGTPPPPMPRDTPSPRKKCNAQCIDLGQGGLNPDCSIRSPARLLLSNLAFTYIYFTETSHCLLGFSSHCKHHSPHVPDSNRQLFRAFGS